MADPTENNVADQQPAGGGEDVVITDRDLYERAISDAPTKPEPTPADQPLLTPDQPQQPTVARDEQGRFAPKQVEQKPAPQQQQPRPEDHRVPLTELLNTRERAQRAEAEAAQLRQAWAALQQQQAAAAQQQQPPQTIFDNPDQYINQNVIQPLIQHFERREIERTDKTSREIANVQFGPQAEQIINAALADLSRIRQTPQGNVLYWQIMNSGHPYGALVQWHKNARAQQQIGPDPEAWFRHRANQLLDDPKFQAAAIERARGRAGQQQRGGNGNVSLPPSLSSIPAAGPRLEEQGDLSDESLYRFATK